MTQSLTLLYPVSKQTRARVLALVHLKHTRLLLLYSEDAEAAKGQPQHLKRLFRKIGPVTKGSPRLEPTAESDFAAIEWLVDNPQPAHRFSLTACMVNSNGGNRLMVMTALRWAAWPMVKTFYLDRRNVLAWFEPRHGDMHTRRRRLVGYTTEALDPGAALRCQIEFAQAQRLTQALVLNVAGMKLSETDLLLHIQNGNNIRPILTHAAESARKPQTAELRPPFSLDEITQLKKGQHSADAVQRVRTNNGSDCGSVRSEAKRTKNLATDWPEKLRQNQRMTKANLAIIGTTCPPADVRRISEHEWGVGMRVGICNTIGCCALAGFDPLSHSARATNQPHQQGTRTVSVLVRCRELRPHIEKPTLNLYLVPSNNQPPLTPCFSQTMKRTRRTAQESHHPSGHVYEGIRGIGGCNALPEVESLALAQPGLNRLG